ncbi:YncE family protein [Jatrophihabitans telluris]|uniref:YncE family protein n=1 Tax=Jatrophihabitans telluris TaxID=2038343 RepID=A0ABY4QYT3_9ACTN|nr:YncE family protein [Jatrophihabitans telluris]UQX88688.1 YncE family protein [Jatrophihabitans telluris]
MTRRSAPSIRVGLAVAAGCVALAGCTMTSRHGAGSVSTAAAGAGSARHGSPSPTGTGTGTGTGSGISSDTGSGGLAGMPRLLSPTDVYAADRPGMISPRIAKDPAYVYVPNTNSNDVSVIDQHTLKVVATFYGGQEPQHVVPSYDLKTLYVTADRPGAGGITPIDPRTGRPGKAIPIDDVYNMYYTPNGAYAIAVQEAYTRLAFYNWRNWTLHDVVSIPSCTGIDHMDFTADGRKLLASCEFSNKLIVVDVASHRLLKSIPLNQAIHGMPQDIKLAPDGKVFYVADMMANGIYLINASSFRVEGFQHTGHGAHGLYISRDSKRMFVTNRDEGSISVIDLSTRKPQALWRLPGGGSPDMGNVSADGKILWLSGRYDDVVYAISTRNGALLAKIRVGAGPHGLAVWPIPGRYSLGHTGILR